MEMLANSATPVVVPTVSLATVVGAYLAYEPVKDWLVHTAFEAIRGIVESLRSTH
jgi:hypothetical protein